MCSMKCVVLLAVLLGQATVLPAADCNTGFSVVAPELAVPGKTTAVLVTLHGPASLQPMNVTLKLLPEGGESGSEHVVETTQEIKGHGILPLEIPADASGSFSLQTVVNCTGSCALQSSSQMRLVGPVRDVIIRPAKQAYQPGETISFWVLALDHDLQIAKETIGSVSVKDPAGTKVAVWDQVPLDEGVKAFELALSKYIRSGKWLLHVEVDSTEFSAPIEVAPGAGGGFPDVAAAEEHYVELRFGREMRRRYKPGLPFSGKVEAVSTEKSVRVRVKVYDNTTSIYSQDIEITAGEGTFVVPAILADSDVIALQAELVSVESKEIESHYVLARETIQKWNSSSDCYLLIEGVEHTLQPEEEAHVAILSTCPCERDLHYVITTDGRVTDWAQRRYEDPVPQTATAPAGAICRLNFSFTVRSVMAPVSQLLVYYITPQGEPVSDVISFDVKLLQRQIYVNLEEKDWWLPSQTLDLEVVAEPSSLVCLLGGRSMGNNDIRFDPRISEEREPVTITGEVDFLEAGVSFFQRQCVKRGDSNISAVSYKQRGSGAGPANRRRPPESLIGGVPFDQLWLWKCFNYTSDIASSGITTSAPSEAGKWSLWALTISSGGLRFSSPVNIRVFRPLQAEFRLPPSLRVRETVEVDIKIGNNINSCMDVTALLALSEGAQFMSNGLLYVTERLRLGPHGATSLVVRVLVTTPGLKNMTVEVNGYTSSSCEGSDKISSNTSLAGAVIRSETVKVHPEGPTRTDTESAYFCANENVIVSTTDKFKYEWIGAPRNKNGIVLEIKSGMSDRIGPVHIALSESRTVHEKMYHITIGDEDNSVTWIGRGRQGYGIKLANAATPDILSEDTWKTFWITWEKNTIVFGTGSVRNKSVLLKWKMDKKIKIQQVGFASGWGSLAEFRIWNFNEEAGFSQVLHLDTPRSVVPGSEYGELLVSGGLSISDLSAKYVGSGLANAIASVTPLLTLQHLGSKVNTTRKQQILNNLPKHIQTILSYRKIDNSFSEHQMLGSHRITIMVLEALVKIQSYFNVDPELILGIKRWVQLRQEDDGSFIPLPADVKLQTSAETKTLSAKTRLVEHITELTAETVMVLYEIGIESDADADTLQKAKVFLESNLPNLETSETIAAVTLALVMVKSATAAWAIEKLRNESTTEDNEFGWTRFIPKRDAADWLYESEAGRSFKEPIAATVGEYRASIYALSTFCLIQDMKFAESAMRYLFFHSHMLDQHPELLYPAVKAFTRYDTLLNDRHRALTISLATSGMELTDTLELKPEQPLQVLHLPSLPTKVFVYATGAGCATIQGRTTYSTYTTHSTTSLLEITARVVQEILPDRSSVEEIEGKSPTLKIKTCFKWKGDGPSGVLRMEVSLFSGFQPSSIPPLLLNKQNITEMLHGFYDNNLWFVFANIPSGCPICVQYLIRSAFVISSIRPAYARVFPASREDLAADTFFHTAIGSTLLRDITDDDLITWFKKNGTNSGGVSFIDLDGCKRSVVKTEATTAQGLSSTTYNSLITNTPHPLDVEKEDGVTHTISADGKWNKSMVVEKTTTAVTENVQVKNISTAKPTEKILTLIVEKEDTSFTKSTLSKVAPKKFAKKHNPNKQNKLTIGEKYLDIAKVPNNTNSTNTNNIKTETIHTTAPSTNIYPVKHVNTKKHDLPLKYLSNKDDDSVNIKTSLPENKNDKYVLLDKEELWGLLKEVVNDEISKKTNLKTLDSGKTLS